MGDGRKHHSPRGQQANEPAQLEPTGRHLAAARKMQQASIAADPHEYVGRFGVDVARADTHAEPMQGGTAVDGLVVAPSSIHGVGVHTEEPLGAGTKLYDVQTGDHMSRPLAKTNRSDNPNATMVTRGDGQLDVVTLGPIEPGQEILIDYPRDSEMPAGSPGMGGNYDP
jgi:hypothetical protein